MLWIKLLNRKVISNDTCWLKNSLELLVMNSIVEILCPEIHHKHSTSSLLLNHHLISETVIKFTLVINHFSSCSYTSIACEMGGGSFLYWRIINGLQKRALRSLIKERAALMRYCIDTMREEVLEKGDYQMHENSIRSLGVSLFIHVNKYVPWNSTYTEPLTWIIN